MSAEEYCIFCYKHREDVAPSCSYELGHEFPAPARAPQPTRKRDAALCLLCGLHPRNPAFGAAGCPHRFEGTP